MPMLAEESVVEKPGLEHIVSQFHDVVVTGLRVFTVDGDQKCPCKSL